MKANMLLSFLSLLLVSSLAAQENVIGFWQGKMQSEYGKYQFNLTVKAQDKDKVLDGGMRSSIKATAMHDRQGTKEVIELNGVIFNDNSVYFSDSKNSFCDKKAAGKVSKLQFLLKYHNGEPVLDGHWQEYKDVKRYRKGRLVLKRSKGKA